VVALDLELRGEVEQGGHAGQEDRRRLAAPARPHEPADRLREVERRRRRRRVDADRQPRDVDALRHHADRDQPPLVALGEVLDPPGGARVVREDDDRRLAGDLAEHGGVGAGGVLVGRDHHAAGVRDAAAQLAEPLVGGGEHRRDPLALRVERGAPRLGDQVLRQRLAEAR
jgi:hypothetical protein